MSHSHYFRAIGLCLAIVIAAPRASAEPPPSNDARSSTVDALVEQGRSVLTADPSKALRLAAEAHATAGAIADPLQKSVKTAQADWLAAAALITSYRATEAVPLLRRALADSAKLSSEPKLLGDLNIAFANANGALGRTEDALYGFQRAFGFYRQAHDARGESVALQNIGTMYQYARNFDQALKYYDQSTAVYRGDPSTQMPLLNNRGIVLRELGKLRQAQSVFSQAAALSSSVKSFTWEALSLTNLAMTQLLNRDVDGADKTIARGFAIVAQNPSVRSQLPSFYAIDADAALQRGDLDRASRRIEQAFAIMGGSAQKILLRDFERTAYDIYKAKGDERRALVHFERYKQLDDDVRALAASTNAALMSARFDFANQNARIAQLRQSEAEQEATIQRNRNAFQRRLLAAGGVILVLLLIGFFSIRRSRNQVRAANDELTTTNVELERALAARTEFLATTSHEIRTPLNGILGMTQVLLADRALDAGVKSKIELVQGAGETMKALVDDILDVAKIANGELTVHPAEMNLQRLLRGAGQVWEAQASTKGVKIEVDIADAPERIIEDEVRLRQIVFNLMANAVKFTDRGAVRLNARFEADGQSASADRGRLVIEISDTGIGIPSDRLDDIFESFRQIDGGTTRQHGGTGLGLAICRSLARAMGGDVTVGSVLGVGSTFIVSLPCERIVRAPVRIRATNLAESRLLLVEANPLARSILTAVFRPNVAHLVAVGDLDEALERLAAEPVDLVLVDAGAIAMELASAAQLAEAAQGYGAGTVLLWPTPSEDVISSAAAAGILRVVSKPIAAPDLVVALRDVSVAEQAREEIAA